jgi:hypothetical protein
MIKVLFKNSPCDFSLKTKNNNAEFFNEVGKAVKERGIKFMIFVRVNNPVIYKEGGMFHSWPILEIKSGKLSLCELHWSSYSVDVTLWV